MGLSRSSFVTVSRTRLHARGAPQVIVFFCLVVLYHVGLCAFLSVLPWGNASAASFVGITTHTRYYYFFWFLAALLFVAFYPAAAATPPGFSVVAVVALCWYLVAEFSTVVALLLCALTVAAVFR